ncbi:MAG TPA: hypothetical protein DET40_09945 [Lentisphaeria bacterium]|nr:MAG: hypothetical protein A2X45_08730 [Lentisphaerae bacterium GWF2_50_93]HCE43857.1 hypothetical protein [Lentisphaeria bacterium]
MNILNPKKAVSSFLIFVFVLILCQGIAYPQEFASPGKIVFIKSDKAAASGFFARQGDKIYVFTSIFALAKGGLLFYTSDGKPVKTGQFEMASDRDLVRISVDSTAAGFFEIDEENVMGEKGTIPSVVMKDSNGEKKTEIQTFSGTVVGIGPEFFRITSPGTASDIAGSPVICENGKAVGAMSYEIPSLIKSRIDRKDNKSISMYVVRWENNTCARLNGEIRWLPVKPQDLVAQAKLITESRNFVDAYMAIMHLWYTKPYDQIDPGGAPVEMKVWIDDHNRKMANSAKYIANMESDINHYQEQARLLQESAKTDGMRLASFISTKATAVKNADGSPYIKLYYSETMKLFEAITQTVSCRSNNLTYIYPNVINKGN